MIKTVTNTELQTHFAKKLIGMLALQLAFVFLMQGSEFSQAPDLETSHIGSGLYKFSNVFCGSGIQNPIAKRKGFEPLSIVSDSVSSECDSILHLADTYQFHDEQKSYDAYRAFIENCSSISWSYTEFVSLGATNADRNADLHRSEEYRDWLKKVLYYNLDTNYYCSDVKEILHTFAWFNDQRGRDWRGNLAVLYFLVKSNKCPKVTAYYDTAVIPATWNQLYVVWQDSVHNSDLTPFDSTLPSLEDLGLGILRNPPADVKKFIDSKLGPIISTIFSTPNPFTSETKIGFTTREAVALKFEVFDVLGKKVFDIGNKVYDQGEDQIVLPGTGLPHGELYGRFSASDGTVKTIKLIHN